MHARRTTTWMFLTAAALLVAPRLAEGQWQVRPAMQGASGLNSIPPTQGPPPFTNAWGYNPSWYYGIRHPPGYTGYYPGYYSYSGYTSPFEARDYPRYYRGMAADVSVLHDVEYLYRAHAARSGPTSLPPGLGTAADNRVRVEVRVPADAEVWFEGSKTSQTGGVRHFVSPALTPGRRHTYTIRARWTENGREVDRTRQLDVWAGRGYTLDFTWPDAGR